MNTKLPTYVFDIKMYSYPEYTSNNIIFMIHDIEASFCKIISGMDDFIIRKYDFSGYANTSFYAYEYNNYANFCFLFNYEKSMDDIYKCDNAEILYSEGIYEIYNMKEYCFNILDDRQTNICLKDLEKFIDDLMYNYNFEIV